MLNGTDGYVTLTRISQGDSSTGHAPTRSFLKAFNCEVDNVVEYNVMVILFHAVWYIFVFSIIQPTTYITYMVPHTGHSTNQQLSIKLTVIFMVYYIICHCNQKTKSHIHFTPLHFYIFFNIVKLYSL